LRAAKKLTRLQSGLGRNVATGTFVSSQRLFVRLSVWKTRGNVMLSTILIIVLILLLIGALPTWPYSSGWGYYPGGGLGLVLIIVLILVLMGRI
jgi:hypothetical protein